MPTERFYRISDEKKSRIRGAALNEFAKMSIEKVSINQIIREAGISRGCFYTYFEDKWDLLAYLLEDYTEKLYDCAERCLEEAEGNIWEMLERLLEQSIELCGEEKQSSFLKYMMSCTDQEELLRVFQRKGMSGAIVSKQSRLEEEVYRQCVGVTITPMDSGQFRAFFQMAMFSISAEVRNFVDGAPINLIWERFRKKERILKRGVNPIDSDCDRQAAITAVGREEKW